MITKGSFSTGKGINPIKGAGFLIIICLLILGIDRFVFHYQGHSTENETIKSEFINLSLPGEGGKYSKINNSLLVPFIQQMPELPRGCEVTSLAMLLNYAGVPVSKMELAEKIDKVPFQINGLKGDMNEGFLGDMYTFDNPGLGVYVKPIYKLANQYLPDRIVDLTGKPIENLYDMIDKGSPVWVITNSRFKNLPESEFKIFTTKNGDMKVTRKEHSVILTGYSKEYVYINDPLTEVPNKAVDRKGFEEAWIQMGGQAISVK